MVAALRPQHKKSLILRNLPVSEQKHQLVGKSINQHPSWRFPIATLLDGGPHARRRGAASKLSNPTSGLCPLSAIAGLPLPLKRRRFKSLLKGFRRTAGGPFARTALQIPFEGIPFEGIATDRRRASEMSREMYSRVRKRAISWPALWHKQHGAS